MSARKQPHRGTPQEWLRHAQSDLALGRLGSGHSEVMPEQVCFHAQQAAEKALKALLVKLAINFPPTHDLEQLLDLPKKIGTGSAHLDRRAA